MANEDKAARYQRLRRRASLLDATLQVAVLLVLVLSGSAVALRAYVESVVGDALVVVVPAYVLIVASLCEAIHLPFAFYQGVVLERRYGLSIEPFFTWLLDHAKAAALVLAWLIVAGMVLQLLMWLAPDRWWILASICFGVALVVLARVAPVYVLPLFYEVRPLEREALRQRMLALAARSRTPVLGVFEWRIGGRTTRANAALTGIGRTRRVLVSDTLLASHSDDEIEAVFAHELAHHVYGDIWSALALEIVFVAVGFYAARSVLAATASTVGLEGKSDVAGLPIVLLIGGAVSILLQPLANALSRAHERRADRYALDMTRNCGAFISAMKRLAARNLAEERPSRLVEILFHTHPSTSARIEAANSWAAGSRLATLGQRSPSSGPAPQARNPLGGT